MKDKLTKEQIIIFSSLVGLVVLIVVLAVSKFSGDDNTETEQVLAINTLPDIPTNPKDEYSDRIKQAEAIRKEEAKENNIKKAQENIQLDVFSSSNGSLPSTPEQSVEVEKKQEPIPVQTKPVRKRKTTQQTTKPVPVETKIEPVEDNSFTGDPDLMFADDTFTDDSFDEEIPNDEFDPNSFSISAVIQDEVTITSGSRVTIRITESKEVDGQTIAKNSFIQAIATFNSQRVNLELPPIKSQSGSTIHKEFVALDANDNMPGLYSRELIGSEIQKDQSSDLIDEAAGEISSGLVRSGIKSISRKKISEQKITIKRNQPLNIIIKD